MCAQNNLKAVKLQFTNFEIKIVNYVCQRIFDFLKEVKRRYIPDTPQAPTVMVTNISLICSVSNY